jgi:hypothetical protein
MPGKASPAANAAVPTAVTATPAIGATHRRRPTASSLLSWRPSLRFACLFEVVEPDLLVMFIEVPLCSVDRRCRQFASGTGTVQMSAQFPIPENPAMLRILDSRYRCPAVNRRPNRQASNTIDPAGERVRVQSSYRRRLAEAGDVGHHHAASPANMGANIAPPHSIPPWSSSNPEPSPASATAVAIPSISSMRVVAGTRASIRSRGFAVSTDTTMNQQLAARIGRNHHPHPGINSQL